MNREQAITWIANAFMPKRLRSSDPGANTAMKHRVLLVLTFTLSAIVWGPIFAVLHFFVFHKPLLGVLALCAVMHGVAILLVLRWTGSLRMAGHLFTASLIFNLALFAALTGGSRGAPLLWAPVVPMVSTLLAGRRAGLAWTLLFIVGTVGLFVYEGVCGPLRSLLEPEAIRINMLTSLVGVQVLAFLLCYGYESIREHGDAAVAAEQATMRQLLSAQEIERQLLAYDIHDGIIQMITGAAMHLDAALAQQAAQPMSESAATQMATARLLLDNSIREARRLVGGLRPPVLDQAGLVAGIEFLISEHPNLKVKFEHDLDLARLSPLIETAMFRICQESLTNAAKYSEADLVEIRLFRKEGQLSLEVRDDGQGFTPVQKEAGLTESAVLLGASYADAKGLGNTEPEDDLRFGLQGIYQRARFLGGAARITSQQGQGTTITVSVPLA